MEYHIANERGDTIASFVNKCDRDYSLDALREKFPDCKLVGIGPDGEDDYDNQN